MAQAESLWLLSSLSWVSDDVLNTLPAWLTIAKVQASVAWEVFWTALPSGALLVVATAVAVHCAFAQIASRLAPSPWAFADRVILLAVSVGFTIVWFVIFWPLLPYGMPSREFYTYMISNRGDVSRFQNVVANLSLFHLLFALYTAGVWCASGGSKNETGIASLLFLLRRAIVPFVVVAELLVFPTPGKMVACTSWILVYNALEILAGILALIALELSATGVGPKHGRAFLRMLAFNTCACAAVCSWLVLMHRDLLHAALKTGAVASSGFLVFVVVVLSVGELIVVPLYSALKFTASSRA